MNPLCLFLVQAALGQAALLSVEVSGIDRSDCTASPCATLSYAISKVASGDVIELGAGTYSGAGNRNLDPGAAGKSNFTIRGKAGLSQTIVDLGRLGRFMALSALAGRLVVSDLTIINGFCDPLPDGSRYGAAFAVLDGSTATLRRLRLRGMNCANLELTFGGEFSGGAFFLKSASALISEVEVVDCVANHGAGAASWGSDASRVEDSTFLHMTGNYWGGTLLAEEASRTEFHRVRFSHGLSAYGGHLDDGTTASPLFKGCLFEYGVATGHGATLYAYGRATSRFEDSIIQHSYTAGSGAAYINAGTLPVFTNVTWINNTGISEAGCIRSLMDGSRGSLRVTSNTFIRCVSDKLSVASTRNSVIFTDCIFRDSLATYGEVLGINSFSGGEPSVFKRCSFINNAGKLAILMMSADEGTSDGQASAIIEDSLFEGNSARSHGGAITVYGHQHLVIRNSTFRNNKAAGSGGAVCAHPNGAMLLEINDTVFEGNSADVDGGAISIAQALVPSVLRMHNSRVAKNVAYRNGAGLSLFCKTLILGGIELIGNRAVDGNGGGMALGEDVDCTDLLGSSFRNVRFIDNFALLSGGAVYFARTPTKACDIPTTGQGGTTSWNRTQPSAWYWDNFSQSVKGNVARSGLLKATPPEVLLVTCPLDDDTCRFVPAIDTSKVEFDSFPGKLVNVEVSLQDGFGQPYYDDVLILEVAIGTGPFLLRGVTKYRFDNGVAKVDTAKVVQSLEGGLLPNNTVATLFLQFPRSLINLKDVPPAKVDLVMSGSRVGGQPGERLGNNLCWAGYVPELTTALPSASTLTCAPCETGWFARKDETVCISCPAGSAANVTGSSGCYTCPVGHGCPSGTSQPNPCAPGSYQPEVGRQECLFCPVGTYQAEAAKSLCSVCQETESTQLRGSNSAELCACPPNTRRTEGRCRSCPVGMDCREWGTDKLKTLPGYMAVAPGVGEAQSSEVEIWKCFADADRCPGGVAGTCAAKRQNTSIACSLCEVGTRPGDGAACVDCSESERVLPILLLITLAVLVISAVYAAVSREDRSRKTRVALLVELTFGQLLTAVQQLGVLSTLSLRWPRPLPQVLNGLSVVVFDIDIIPVGCVTPMKPMGRLVLRVCMILVLLVSPVFVHLFATCVLHRGTFLRNLPHLIGTVGLLFMALILTIFSSIVYPFQCQEQPSGLFTMRADDGVVCWALESGSPHEGMIILSSVSCLLPLGFFAWMVVVARLLPQKIQEGDVTFLHMYCFLFSRFALNFHWFVEFHLLRNIAVALVPILPGSAVQWSCLLIIFCITLVVTTRLLPWRTPESNFCELFCFSNLALLLIVGGPFVDDPSETSAGIFGIVLLIFICICGLAVFFIAAYERMLRRGKPFQFFLCHHKAGSGNLARALKMSLVADPRVRRQVFLDSDNLAQLEYLFGYVRTEVGTVVVLCSRDVLYRPWCMGEITTAHVNNVQTLRVMLPDFSMPTTEVIDQFASLTSMGILSEFGISTRLIQEALQYLPQTIAVKCPGGITNQIIQDVTNQILTRRSSVLPLENGEQGSASTAARPAVFNNAILADMTDTEASAAAVVVSMMLAPFTALLHGIFVVYELDRTFPEEISRVVLVCTNGALLKFHVVQALLQLQENTHIEPVVCEPSFRFPSAEFYAEVKAEVVRRDLVADGQDYVDLLTGIFSSIAIDVDPQASEDVLMLGVMRLAKRFQSKGLGSGSLGRLSSSRRVAARSLMRRPQESDGTGTANLSDVHINVREDIADDVLDPEIPRQTSRPSWPEERADSVVRLT